MKVIIRLFSVGLFLVPVSGFTQFSLCSTPHQQSTCASTFVGILTQNPSEALDVNGNVHLGAGAQVRTTFSMSMRDTSANTRTVVRIMPNGTVGTIPSALEFFGTDFVANGASYERLSLRSKGPDDAAYLIFTEG